MTLGFAGFTSVENPNATVIFDAKAAKINNK
jgi:hypothetical protein